MNKTANQVRIYPALLSDQLADLQSQILKIIDMDTDLGVDSDLSSVNKVVQIDIIDGKFADNLTCTPTDLLDFNFGEFKIDFHLMTEDPMDYVHELIDVKNQLPVRAIIGQVERMTSQAHFLEEVRQQQWLPGLSLDLFTPVEAIDAESWEKLQVVQVMGVAAGFQGQQFHPSSLQVIAELRPLCTQHEVELIVDGGVNLETVSAVIKAGADSVAVGSSLWQSTSISDTIAQLKAKTNFS